VVEFKRKKGESFEGFLRRFSRGLQNSKKLLVVRKTKYLKPKKSKSEKKKSVLIGKKLHSKREYLKKTGKLKEEPRKRW